MISKKSKYALKALEALGEKPNSAEQPLLIAEIAKEKQIPRKFLETILLDLKNHGVLRSKMGKGGGYYLARAAEKITLGEVVRILEGPLAPLPCLSRMAYKKCEGCMDETHCGIRLVFKDVHEATLKILDMTSLQDMIDKSRAGQAVCMYHI